MKIHLHGNVMIGYYVGFYTKHNQEYMKHSFYQDPVDAFWDMVYLDRLYVNRFGDHGNDVLRWLIDNQVDFTVEVLENNNHPIGHREQEISFQVNIRNPDHAVWYKLVWGGR